MTADLSPQGANAVRLAMRAVHLARERDRARAIAVALEQRLYLTRQRLVSLGSAWRITSHMSASAWLYGCTPTTWAEVRAALEAPDA